MRYLQPADRCHRPRPERERRRLPAHGSPALAVALVAVVVGGCMPTPASSQGQQISNLYTVFLIGGIIVATIVWGLVTWSILRYRRRDDRLPDQTSGDLRIEAIWTLIPLATVLVLFFLTVQTISSVSAVEPGGVNLRVTAFRWQWSATYPDSNVTVTGTDAANLEIVLPVDTPVHVTLVSLDVNHAFYVPSFLFKRDAIPGKPTTFDIRVTSPGVYPGQCAELCGIGHYLMQFTIRGVDMATFKAWLAAHAAAGSTAP
jgi:cytochrome c oxidase subunit II